jgi:hypothetical protein
LPAYQGLNQKTKEKDLAPAARFVGQARGASSTAQKPISGICGLRDMCCHI